MALSLLVVIRERLGPFRGALAGICPADGDDVDPVIFGGLIRSLPDPVRAGSWPLQPCLEGIPGRRHEVRPWKEIRRMAILAEQY